MPARLSIAIAFLLICTQMAACDSVAPAAESNPSISAVRVGIDGYYKRGEWTPIRIETQRSNATAVRVTAPDSDGLRVVYEGDLVDSPNGNQQAEVLIRVGRRDAPVELQLLGGEGPPNKAVTLQPSTESFRAGLPANARLLAECRLAQATSGSPMLDRLAQSRRFEQPPAIANVGTLAELPQSVDGYAALDALLIVAGDAKQSQISAEDTRIESLQQWVRLGGRLVIACGQGAKSIAGQDGLLADLMPAALGDTTTLTDATPIERYAGATSPVAAGGRLAIPVVRFSEVKGQIVSQVADLPLVIRSRQGFGEVIAVAFDPTADALSDWEGTERLLSVLCNAESRSSEAGIAVSSGALMTTGYSDLSGALYQRLGAKFAGVGSSPFLAVVVAILAYLLLIGPGDYFLVRYGIKRMEMTWITFPLIALLFGGGAYWLSGMTKANVAQANQLELVDIDLRSRVARGTVWGQIYSPTADRYEVGLAPRDMVGNSITQAKFSTSWWGLPGSGLGGLESVAGGLTSQSTEYLQSDSREQLVGMPVNIWSTKAVTAHWHAQLPQVIDSTLASQRSGLVEGIITNTSAGDLTSAILIDGDWAWRLGSFSAGETLAINDRRSPLKLKTLIRRDYLQTSANQQESRTVGGLASQSAQALRVDRLSEISLLYLIMLQKALGGTEFTTLKNDVQRQLDLSRLLDGGNNDGSVMLIAQGVTGGSRLLNAGKPWSEDGGPVIYRIVIPVENR